MFSWLKTWLFGPTCPAGDIACELTEGYLHLPSILSETIATIEQEAGISRYQSGPIVIGFIGVMTWQWAKRRYRTDNPLDLIYNIITEEFGPLAKEIFAVFERELEKNIENYLSYHKDRLSPNAFKEAKKSLMAEKARALAPSIGDTLKQNHAAIENSCEKAPDMPEAARAANVRSGPSLEDLMGDFIKEALKPAKRKLG